MNAENEFEKWWEDTSYGETVPLTDWQLRDTCYAAFTLGRKSGLEEAEEIADTCDCDDPYVCGCVEISARICQRVEEMK